MELKKLFVLILVVFFMSCMKDEIPVGMPSPGEIEQGQVDMESDYKYQIYFNLQRGENVAQNLREEWDIGFECAEDGNHIILNSSKLMFAVSAEKTDFSSVKDTAGLKGWKFDGVTGDLDSTAIGNWQSKPLNVYIINRGVSIKGRQIGLYKLVVKSLTNNAYSIQYGALDSDQPMETIIQKDQNVNYIYFSFDNEGEVKNFEPLKNDWDLLFTSYTESLYDGTYYIPYIVVGAQINRQMTLSAVDENIKWDDMTLEKATSYNLSSRIDQPGYKWKSFNLDEGTYVVRPEMIYIIKTQYGLYYKLRFIDFYNDTGEKGRPIFEYQQL